MYEKIKKIVGNIAIEEPMNFLIQLIDDSQEETYTDDDLIDISTFITNSPDRLKELIRYADKQRYDKFKYITSIHNRMCFLNKTYSDQMMKVINNMKKDKNK